MKTFYNFATITDRLRHRPFFGQIKKKERSFHFCWLCEKLLSNQSFSLQKRFVSPISKEPSRGLPWLPLYWNANKCHFTEPFSKCFTSIHKSKSNRCMFLEITCLPISKVGRFSDSTFEKEAYSISWSSLKINRRKQMTHQVGT